MEFENEDQEERKEQSLVKKLFKKEQSFSEKQNEIDEEQIANKYVDKKIEELDREIKKFKLENDKLKLAKKKCED